MKLEQQSFKQKFSNEPAPEGLAMTPSTTQTDRSAGIGRIPADFETDEGGRRVCPGDGHTLGPGAKAVLIGVIKPDDENADNDDDYLYALNGREGA